MRVISSELLLPDLYQSISFYAAFLPKKIDALSPATLTLLQSKRSHAWHRNLPKRPILQWSPWARCAWSKFGFPAGEILLPPRDGEAAVIIYH